MKTQFLLPLLLLILAANTIMIQVHATTKLTKGATWKLRGDYALKAVDVNGSLTSTYSDTGHSDRTIRITSVSDTSLTATMIFENYWSCANSGNAFEGVCNPTAGQDSKSSDYTISLPDLKIISTTGDQRWVGHYAWFLVNTPTLLDGGTVQIGWYTPTSDFKNSIVSDVSYSVTTQQVKVQGTSLTAWNVSHTGLKLGYFSDAPTNGVFSRGPDTDSFLYDPLYGTFIGASYNSLTSYPGPAGWNEVYTCNEMLVSSSLTF